jgi:hemerythrin
MFIEWLPSYSVEVEEIDDQHKRFVLLINDLADAVEIGCEDVMMGDVIKQLVAYADYHFATEEKYFDQFDYPDGDNHKNIHQGFRDKVNGFSENYLGQEKKYAGIVMKFMKDWLTKHIITVDKAYSEFFKDHGLK